MKKGHFIGAAVAFVIVVLLVAKSQNWLVISPAEIQGGPVRVVDAQGDRLYLLTSQWERRTISSGHSRSSSSTRQVSWMSVDLWAFDAVSAQPVFRRRLRQAKVHGSFAAMGVDQGVLWARVPDLLGIRLADGALVADSASIEARNPALAGLMPKSQGIYILPESMQPLKFLPGEGLVVQLADARRVRIDARTLLATPYEAPTRERAAEPDTEALSRYQPVTRLSSGMEWNALVRGLAIDSSGPVKHWLGLVADSELADLRDLHTISQSVDYSEPRRHRLYRAELHTTQEFLGIRQQIMNPTPLPESPEFIMGGLLTATSGGSRPQPALWRSDPDSVFVLSRDRVGADGHLQLTRIAGPGGRVVWSTALPLSEMRAWLPGERHAVMLGPDPAAPRSSKGEEGENDVMQIVSIDLVSGALQSFNLDLHRDWPVDEPAAAKP